MAIPPELVVDCLAPQIGSNFDTPSHQSSSNKRMLSSDSFCSQILAKYAPEYDQTDKNDFSISNREDNSEFLLQSVPQIQRLDPKVKDFQQLDKNSHPHNYQFNQNVNHLKLPPQIPIEQLFQTQTSGCSPIYNRFTPQSAPVKPQLRSRSHNNFPPQKSTTINTQFTYDQSAATHTQCNVNSFIAAPVQVVPTQLDMNQLQLLAKMVVQQQQLYNFPPTPQPATSYPIYQAFDHSSSLNGSNLQRSLETQQQKQQQVEQQIDQNNSYSSYADMSMRSTAHLPKPIQKQQICDIQTEVSVLSILTLGNKNQTETENISDEKQDQIKKTPEKQSVKKSQINPITQPRATQVKSRNMMQKSLDSTTEIKQLKQLQKTQQNLNASARKPFSQIQNGAQQQFIATPQKTTTSIEKQKSPQRQTAKSSQIPIVKKADKILENKMSPYIKRSSSRISQQLSDVKRTKATNQSNKKISEEIKGSECNSVQHMKTYDGLGGFQQHHSIEMFEPAIIYSTKKPIANFEAIVAPKWNGNQTQQINLTSQIKQGIVDLKEQDSLLEFQYLEKNFNQQQEENSSFSGIASEKDCHLTQCLNKTQIEPSLQEELEALKQQRDAQEVLIENLRSQIELEEMRSQALIKINNDLNMQLDYISDRELLKKSISIQTDFRPALKHMSTQSDFTENLKKNLDAQYQSYTTTPSRKLDDQYLSLATTPVRKIQNSSILHETLQFQSAARCEKQETAKKHEDRLLEHQSRVKQFEMVFLSKYHQKISELIEKVVQPDGKILKRYVDKTETQLPSGVRREQYLDGYFVIYFENGDVRQTYPDGKVVYLFKEAGVTQTELSCGQRVLLFKNGQLEKHLSDGSKQIFFSDGGKKFVNAEGVEIATNLY